ncbi:hypothetical protein G9A89_002293 [Geosiphon pyriformis]|nr:hypothetical protein G9A89_002293 [Geosiphon pyriformis]
MSSRKNKSDNGLWSNCALDQSYTWENFGFDSDGDSPKWGEFGQGEEFDIGGHDNTTQCGNSNKELSSTNIPTSHSFDKSWVDTTNLKNLNRSQLNLSNGPEIATQRDGFIQAMSNQAKGQLNSWDAFKFGGNKDIPQLDKISSAKKTVSDSKRSRQISSNYPIVGNESNAWGDFGFDSDETPPKWGNLNQKFSSMNRSGSRSIPSPSPFEFLKKSQFNFAAVENKLPSNRKATEKQVNDVNFDNGYYNKSKTNSSGIRCSLRSQTSSNKDLFSKRPEAHHEIQSILDSKKDDGQEWFYAKWTHMKFPIWQSEQSLRDWPEQIASYRNIEWFQKRNYEQYYKQPRENCPKWDNFAGLVSSKLERINPNPDSTYEHGSREMINITLQKMHLVLQAAYREGKNLHLQMYDKHVLERTKNELQKKYDGVRIEEIKFAEIGVETDMSIT